MDILNELPFTFWPLLISWLLVFLFAFLRPQRLLNTFLLLFALLISVITITARFGQDAPEVLFLTLLLVAVGLLSAPALLVMNGLTMMKKESRSLPNLLSLFLGIFVGAGELAVLLTVILGFSGAIEIRHVYLLLFVGASVFYFSFLILIFVLYMLFMQILPHRHNFNYIIIHGCGLLQGERVSPLLAGRIEKAIDIYDKGGQKAKLMPSGGQGEGEKISEAEAMRRYLLKRGIPDEDILIEDQSFTTEENLRNCKALIDQREGKKKTALVTSNYHVYRCILLAEELKMKCTGIGAPVAAYYWPSAVIREFAAVFSRRRYLAITALGYLLLVVTPLVILYSLS
ncbi:MAG: YdcF family protein [Erysipelotrichaceae bacterium]|nr:YdcF family protein [Erysipelotrichaceae bacterium]